MNIEQQILNLLRNNSYPLTDNEIASRIDRPAPSVRRTRYQLEMNGLVTRGTPGKPMTWMLTPATAPRFATQAA